MAPSLFQTSTATGFVQMKLSRRYIISNAAAIGTLLYAPAVWSNPSTTLNPSPTGDDAPQLNTALAAIRSAGRGTLILDQIGTAPFNVKSCINATGLGFAEIIFTAGTLMRCDGFTQTAPMIDLSNSYFSRISGSNNIGSIIFGLDANSPVGTVKPCCAILCAGGDSKGIRDMATSGSFASAAIAVVATSSFSLIRGGYGNYDNTSPTLTISSKPDWGLQSPFTTFVAANCNDIHIETEMHQFGNAPWALYLRDVHDVEFYGLLLDGGTSNRAIAQGQCGNVSFFGGASGEETLPDTATSVLTCGSPDACVNLHFYNHNPGALPYINGSGNFSGFLVN
jgi:hypothetical protein